VALKDASSHDGGKEDAIKTARLLAAVGREPAPFLVLADKNGSVPERTLNAGRITAEMGLSSAEWKTFAHGADAIARAVREATGLRTVFHHHCGGVFWSSPIRKT
jgi:inosose dehydratase